MNTSFYIAKRYLFSKKSRNAINIISAISLTAVTAGTCALVIVISVFNGFDEIITAMYNRIDPDIKITAASGKTINAEADEIKQLRKDKDIKNFYLTVDDLALIRYKDKTWFANVKGVNNDYISGSYIDSMIVEGNAVLKSDKYNLTLVGQGIAYFLGVFSNTAYPIEMYAPSKNTAAHGIPLEEMINRKLIYPCGIFSAQQEIDSKYMFVDFAFAKELFELSDNEVSAVEIRLHPGIELKDAKEKFSKILGDNYIIKTRYELNATLYKVMQSEKWAIFFILSFILIIASFNIIGSLTMLILDKKNDIETLKSLGASRGLIKRIFLFEGWVISLGGAIAGLILGIVICWLQDTFGFVRLRGSESFIINHYPVSIVWGDIFIIVLIVLSIGFVTAWYPVRHISKRMEF